MTKSPSRLALFCVRTGLLGSWGKPKKEQEQVEGSDAWNWMLLHTSLRGDTNFHRRDVRTGHCGYAQWLVTVTAVWNEWRAKVQSFAIIQWKRTWTVAFSVACTPQFALCSYWLIARVRLPFAACKCFFFPFQQTFLQSREYLNRDIHPRRTF